jgi:eukaryotic-like serine/threonine-protein kinase
MVKTACPPREALWQLLQRQLPADQARNLERHLRDCPPCAQAYQMLKEDSLPDAATLAPVDSGSPPVQRPATAATPQTFTFLAPAQQPDELGRLGPYRVLKVLGQGGMGVVFRAEDSRLQRSVALKVMLPDQAQRPEAKERFLREARAAAALEHDNIVAIYQVDEDRGVAYIAMPFLKGMSLDGWLKQKQQDGRGTPVKLSQVCKIGREIARGLAAAHARGLVHRDIKPANIWLDATAGGRVKILDFGLARATSGEQHLTQSGVIVGTPAYMAPEQAQGKPVDARADLFSLGVVLYRMCTGTLPFAGADLVSTLVAVATTDPPAPRSLNPELPPALSDLVMKLLAKDPAQRVASAQEVVKAIQAIEKDLQAGSGRMAAETFPIEPVASQTVPLPTPRPARKPAASTGRTAPGKRRGKARKNRGRLLAAGILIVLIGVSVFLGWTFLWHRSPLPPTAVAPFDAAAAKRSQEAWAKHLKMPVVATNSLGMKLVLIPPGEFLMGFTAAEVEDLVGKTKLRIPKKGAREAIEERLRGASPQHRVTLTHPYLLGMNEVTVGQFGKFVKDAGYRTEAERSGVGATIYDPVVKRFYADPKANWHNLGFPQTNDHPVGAVSWSDAVAFCEWLSRKEGRTYRLPTEAEWEFAGRAGTTTLTPYGPGVTEQEAVFNRDKSGWPEPVGTRLANAFGLHDMIGNVWEWCADWYRPYVPGDQTDPPGPADGDERVLRGSCYNSDWIIGTANRHHRNPDAAAMAFGFRVVCEVAPPPPSGFVSLFNGKDLTGWKTHPSQPGGWSVEDGLLVGRSATANHLFSQRGDYENLHLRAEARINKYGNSGIYFRSNFAVSRGGKYPNAYEAQILHSYLARTDAALTGSLLPLANVVKPLVEPDDWFTLEVLANGNRLLVKVNGQVTADVVDQANTYRKGHLALQAMSDKITNVTTVVQFRSIEIKELPSAVAALVPLDLLALIDPGQDRVDGNWQRNLAGELLSDETARLQIPYRPPAEYNLDVAFTRISGNADVNQYLVGAGRQVMFMLGGWDNTLGGLDMVDGKRIDENRTGFREGASLQNGRRYATQAQVRKNGVKLFLDRVPLLEFKTNFANVGLDPNWLLRDPTLLGLGSYASPTVFHRVEIVELSGPGMFLRPNDPAAKRARAPH